MFQLPHLQDDSIGARQLLDLSEEPMLQFFVFECIMLILFFGDDFRPFDVLLLAAQSEVVDAGMTRCNACQPLHRVIRSDAFVYCPQPQHHVLCHILSLFCREAESACHAQSLCAHFHHLMFELFWCHLTYITNEHCKIKQKNATFFRNNTFTPFFLLFFFLSFPHFLVLLFRCAHNLKIDVPHIGSPTCPMSIDRCAPRRFRGCF